MREINEALKLSRWKDVIPFTLPVVLLGFVLGINSPIQEVNWEKLVIGTLASVIAVSFAFVINEIEDAEDDGKKINLKLAQKLAIITFLLSLILYAVLGMQTLIVGFLILILGFLYSWKPVRLKAWPIVDILSHCLMLGGLLFLSGFYIQGKSLDQGIYLFLAITLASVYGQFYNQVRDFEADKKAKLNNTSILMGKGISKTLMYLVLVTTILITIYCFVINLLPIWFIVVGIIFLVLSILIFKDGNLRERDKKSGVFTVSAHFPFLMALISLIFVYLILR
ncbi:hypothetical protein BH10PAT1_BH10PAT1_1180 [soil metagenome]